VGVECFILDRPKMANTSVHLDELMTEPLEVSKLRDLVLGLAHGGVVGQRFGYGSTIGLIGEPQIGTVAGLAG
jgi:hypothetical protein